MFTDIASLLVLAICIPRHGSRFSATAFTLQLLELAIYVPLVLFGLSAAVRYLMERMKESKEGQFHVMLLAVAVAGNGAQLINLEGIIGAFLAGLALNRAVHHSPAKAELEFLGNTIFVPIFFITIRFLIAPQAFAETAVGHLELVIAIVAGLIVAKLVAAKVAQKMFRYTGDEPLAPFVFSPSLKVPRDRERRL